MDLKAVVCVFLVAFCLQLGTAQVLRCNFDTASTGGIILPCVCGGSGCTLEQSDQQGNIDWTVNKGSTSSSDTGPEDDHTRGDGTGQYIYVEASNNQPNDFAEITTPLLSLSTTSCLSFWYHMKGQHIGALEVLATYKNLSKGVIWERTGEQSDDWIEGLVRLPDTIDKVHFNAIRGGSAIGMPYGDIALDDIKIEESLCRGFTEPTTEAPATTSTSALPTTPTTRTPSTRPPTTLKPTTPTTRSPTTTSTTTSPQSTQSTKDPSNTSPSSPDSSTFDEGLTAPSSGSGSDGSQTSLWGLDETLWIIIFVVAGVVILILLIIVCVQACAMRRMRTARIMRQSDDYSNIEAYNRDHPPPTTKHDNYINAYDNMALETDDKMMHMTHTNGHH